MNCGQGRTARFSDDALAKTRRCRDARMKSPDARRNLILLLIVMSFLGGCGQSVDEIASGTGEFGAGALSGQALFLVACSGCHRIEPGGGHDVGPNLAGIAGTPAAGADDYRYSSGLAESGLSWDRATLAAWIAATEILVPGTTMTYSNILTGEEVALVVDYLFDPTSELQGEPR